MTKPNMPSVTDSRPFGFWTAIALVVGNMIGSGIFLLPATLAPLGSNALIGWVVTIAGAMALAYVFARLARLLPAAGGPYAYAQSAFGPGVGFAVAWSYWVLLWSGNGAIAVAAVSALTLIVPQINGHAWLPAALALMLVWLLVAINIGGVAIAGRVQIVTAALKLLPLVGVIAVALWLLLRDGSAAIAPQTGVPITAGAIAGAAALTFWSFLGVESATIPADRVANARRVVPMATMIGTGLTGLVYLGVAASIALLMPPQQTAFSPAPIAEFLGMTLGPAAATVIALFAIVSAFGALNGFVMLQGEMPKAMARGGVFPAWFDTTEAAATPVRSHLVSASLLSGVMMLNYGGSTTRLFSDIATISLAAGMVAYLVSALAALRMMPRDPGVVIATILSSGFVGWMVWGLGAKACMWGAGLMIAGLPIYWVVRRSRRASDPDAAVAR